MTNKDILNILSDKKVLCADDDKELLNNLKEILELFFKDITLVQDGEKALEEATTNHYDLMMFDITMPYINGLDVIKNIRKCDKTTPIIVMSAHHTEEYLFKAVDLKLTQYIIKPFTKDQILEALEKVAIELAGENGDFRLSPYCVYKFSTKQLCKNSEAIQLSKSESRFIEFLIKNRNQVITYDAIFDYMYDFEKPTKESIKFIVKSIRKKVGESDFIKNVYGVGYLFEI